MAEEKENNNGGQFTVVTPRKDGQLSEGQGEKPKEGTKPLDSGEEKE